MKGFKKMVSRDVAVEDIKVNIVLTEEQKEIAKELSEDLLNIGFFTAPPVLRFIDGEDEEFEVLSGKLQIAAAQIAGVEYINAYVVDSEMDTTQLISFTRMYNALALAE